MQALETFGRSRAELTYRCAYALQSLGGSAHVGFAEKFVGVAHEALKRVAWAKIVAGIGHSCSYDIGAGEAGAGVALSHACGLFRSSGIL